LNHAETSTLLLQLYQRYQQEGQIMPDMLEEVARETIDRLLKELPVEKRLEGLTPEQRVQGLPAEKRLEGLTPEQRVQGLSAETLRELLEKLEGNGASPKPE